MAYKKNNKSCRIAAIVPAYNEGRRIGDVLKVLCNNPLLDEVIVVDDGSADNTSKVAAEFPVRLLRIGNNIGKGGAMDLAVENTSAEIIFFCDADVKGLRKDVIDETLAPVLSGEKNMMIAMRNRKIIFLRYILFCVPLLGGERALTRDLWQKIPQEYKYRFRIEAALNFYARWYGAGFGYIVFHGLRQTIKEKKYGFLTGFAGRIRMFIEVSAAHIMLYADLSAKLFSSNKQKPQSKRF